MYGWHNRLEMVNESLVLISSYFLLIYSDGVILKELLGHYVRDVETEEFFGTFHVTLLLIQVVINFIVIFTINAFDLHHKFKLCLHKRRQKRAIERQN